jgi:hypothetical protein
MRHYRSPSHHYGGCHDLAYQRIELSWHAPWKGNARTIRQHYRELAAWRNHPIEISTTPNADFRIIDEQDTFVIAENSHDGTRVTFGMHTTDDIEAIPTHGRCRPRATAGYIKLAAVRAQHPNSASPPRALGTSVLWKT